ncbi:hypothetical protein F5144DRAFT_285079 [Chaetomium tenue]|uniref:Uncharacterized protein n=1 Tax=Chaetomium tenue TaxID=1854479 RepID=A0ACB7P1G8_9PEZI|nr:hypothetical protein F5144DRAFT_285079 [Chaetomium globosum]
MHDIWRGHAVTVTPPTPLPPYPPAPGCRFLLRAMTEGLHIAFFFFFFFFFASRARAVGSRTRDLPAYTTIGITSASNFLLSRTVRLLAEFPFFLSFFIPVHQARPLMRGAGNGETGDRWKSLGKIDRILIHGRQTVPGGEHRSSLARVLWQVTCHVPVEDLEGQEKFGFRVLFGLGAWEPG